MGRFSGLLFGSTSLSTPPGLLADAAAAFSPASLFASGEQGVWYDPSDLTTLFQDSAGTTPVTGLEQPVGLMLDKSGRGNHASQSTPTSRPVLSARYNLLTYSEQFDNAYWGTASRVTISANTSDTTDPLGGNTADKMVEVAVSGTHRVQANQINAAALGLVNISLKTSIYFKKGTRDWGWLAITDSVGVSAAFAWFDLTNGTVGTVSVSGSASGQAATIASVGNDWYHCTLTAKASTSPGDAFAFFGVATGDNIITYNGDITKHIYLWGADLRVSNDGVGLPAYQRVGAATAGSSTAAGTADYDSTGFPAYLRFDGTDDSMATSAIDFTATDEVSLFAGVRKLSDAALANIVELSADLNTTTGVFDMRAPALNGDTSFRFGSKGTLFAGATTTAYTAPVSAILTGLGDIGADQSVLRLNGTQVASSANDQGTGNYGNHILYIGSRGGSSLRYNGRLYSLIALGRTATATEITNTETWVNNVTKAY